MNETAIAKEIGRSAPELRKTATWLDGFAAGIKDEQGEGAAEVRRQAYELREMARRLEDVIA